MKYFRAISCVSVEVMSDISDRTGQDVTDQLTHLAVPCAVWAGMNDSFVSKCNVRTQHSSHQSLMETDTICETSGTNSTLAWMISLKSLHCIKYFYMKIKYFVCAVIYWFSYHCIDLPPYEISRPLKYVNVCSDLFGLIMICWWKISPNIGC
jgi:hypothetical protein